MNRFTSQLHVLPIVLLTILLLAPAAGNAQELGASEAEGFISTTRDEYLQDLRAYFAFEEAAYQGGTITIADTADIITLNGLLASDFPSRYVTQIIFEKLATVSPIDGIPVPQLADYWEISADGRVFTFHLSQDAKWHDGTDFTAHDVYFSFEAAMSGSLQTSQFDNLKNQIASTQVIDDDTFQLIVTDPTVTFLWDIAAQVSILPKHLWEGVNMSEWGTDEGSTGEDPSRVIGTGPFKFQEWVRNDRVTLVRNADHYSSPPHIDAFVLRKVGANERPSALKAGIIDIVEGIDLLNISDEVNDGSIIYQRYPTNSMQYYVYNIRNPPFDDVLVRRALFIALDRQTILREVNGGYGVVTTGTHSPLSFAYAPDSMGDLYTYDEERAREMLGEAGWSDSDNNGIVDKDGEDLRITIVANAEISQVTQLLEEMRAYWGAIGVATNIPEPERWDSLQGKILKGELEFDVIIRNKRWNPSGNQGSLFHGDPPGGDNLAGWWSPEYDSLDNQQMREFDPDKRRDLLIELSRVAWNEMPVGILRFIASSIAYSPSVHNFEPNALAGTYWSVPFVWKDPPAT